MRGYLFTAAERKAILLIGWRKWRAATGYRLPRIYDGYVEERPETVQTKLEEKR
ncbi:MAG: hypothetical protein QXY46_05935 [Candidatus Bathyarchaeia archaeon]